MVERATAVTSRLARFTLLLGACAALWSGCQAPRANRIERGRDPGLAALLPAQPLRWLGEAPVDEPSDRNAVLVAVDRHAEHPEWDLPGARASMDRLATALVERCGVPRRALTQLAGEGAHRDAILAAIAAAGRQSRGPRALLLVGFAGHGFVDGEGEPLLFTHFTRAAPGGGFEGALARRELLRAVEEARRNARARDVELDVAFVIDACRVGVAAPPPVARLVQAPLWELWSTRPGAYAQAEGSGPFAFSAALATAIDVLAQSGDEVDLARVAEEARVRVRLAAPLQEPELRPPQVGAEPPVLVVRDSVTFHIAVVDALSGARVPKPSVRCGGRVFPGDAAGLVRLVLPRGPQQLGTTAVGYLARVDTLELDRALLGNTLELLLYPELTLVEGRVVPPAIVAVRARGLPDGRENFHRTRTVTDRDGSFSLRLPGLRLGAELEFVVDERVAVTVPLPGEGQRTVAAAPGIAVGLVELEVALDAGPVAKALTQLPPSDRPRPSQWPEPAAAADAPALARVQDLVERGRYDMARDALAALPVRAGDAECAAAWLRWLDLEAAARGPQEAALRRLQELSGEPHAALRLAIGQELLRRATEVRDADAQLELAEVAASCGLAQQAEFAALQRELLPEAVARVLREGLASGVATDDWQRADRAMQLLLDARYLWLVEARPELAELAQEVRRERMPAACRVAWQRGEAAFADGRLAEARTCYERALVGANEAYRDKINARLASLDEKLYVQALDDGTRHELAGRLGAALEAYARAYAKSPRAKESLRRLLRQPPRDDTGFVAQYEALRKRFLAAAQTSGDSAAWAELAELFGADPKVRDLLRARLIDPWAEVLEAGDSKTGLPSRVRDKRSGLVLLLVEPGEFWMGAPDDDALATAVERPRHRVTISKAFYLGETEVSWQVWRRFAPEAGTSRDLEAPSVEHPVAGISWEEAQWFCAHLGLRLPTEAEWEYASFAGAAEYRRYVFSRDLVPPSENVRRGDEDSGDRDVFLGSDGYVETAPVGRGEANAWGFRDMLGNLREWCADGFDARAYALRRDGATDPFTPPPPHDAVVVVRGGSYRDGPRAASSVTRAQARIDAHLPWLGVRVARSVW